MLDLIGSSIIGLLLEIFGRSPVTLEPLQLLSWQESAIFNLPATEPDPAVEGIVNEYINNLASAGISPQKQGIWLQSDWNELVTHQGTTPASAASLTKIATTLAVLAQWRPAYQFETKIYATGAIKDGILQGDLIVVGSQDPFFVWEEAIALGNALQQLGIGQVTGNLVVNDQFYMNYQSQPLVAGELFKQALDVRLWPAEASQQYLTLPLGTARPQLAIATPVRVDNQLPANARLLISHQSLPLAEILKQMNIYSNNEMAQMLADALGGAQEVAKQVAKITNVPPAEIQLVNGSGLGVENRLSPRAVCLMLMAIEQLLQSYPLKVADLFPVAGRDTVGTMQERSIPSGIVVKTGTLAQVSALAGQISTRDRGQIWFAIINSGTEIDYLRQQQDRFLQRLANHWQLAPRETPSVQNNQPFLGDPQRNLLADN
jgi:D-alanyl-D-alanine carboxypeptidase/D-alanyl-D-alanine-endopeptidase (penicillin-binding protein 4)